MNREELFKKHFEHYETGSEENKRIDLAKDSLKRSIEKVVQNIANRFVKDYIVTEKVTYPPFKKFIKWYRDEIESIVDKRAIVVRLRINIAEKLFWYILQRDSYYRDRFIYMVLKLQKDKPLNESSINAIMNRDLQKQTKESLK